MTDRGERVRDDSRGAPEPPPPAERRDPYSGPKKRRRTAASHSSAPPPLSRRRRRGRGHSRGASARRRGTRCGAALARGVTLGGSGCRWPSRRRSGGRRHRRARRCCSSRGSAASVQLQRLGHPLQRCLGRRAQNANSHGDQHRNETDDQGILYRCSAVIGFQEHVLTHPGNVQQTPATCSAPTTSFLNIPKSACQCAFW